MICIHNSALITVKAVLTHLIGCLFVFFCKVLEQAEPLPELGKIHNRKKKISGVRRMSKTPELFPKRSLSLKHHSPLSITITFCLCNRFMTQYPELSLVALFSH